MKLKILHYSTEAKSVLHLTAFSLPFSLFPASRALWLLCLNVLFEMPRMGKAVKLRYRKQVKDQGMVPYLLATVPKTTWKGWVLAHFLANVFLAHVF